MTADVTRSATFERALSSASARILPFVAADSSAPERSFVESLAFPAELDALLPISSKDDCNPLAAASTFPTAATMSSSFDVFACMLNSMLPRSAMVTPQV